MTDISKDYEALCDQEFTLARREVFENLDREIADIKGKMASTGNFLSSRMARAVADAIRARFDKVLLAFEHAYLGKWADSNRDLSESDYTWLKGKVAEKLDPEVMEARSRCNGGIFEPEVIVRLLYDGWNVFVTYSI